ncbi:hypothetical protein PM082_003840 [Marasmius tenuissimus]|nr:hypothetical protein PM082_003840 [Marasmius tenuissimus]
MADPAQSPQALPYQPYQPSDLRGLTKSQLAELVLREVQKWPHKPATERSIGKAKNEVLVSALLGNGFNRNAPPRSQAQSSTALTSLSQTPSPDGEAPPSGGTGVVPGLQPHNLPGGTVNPYHLTMPASTLPERRNLQVFVMDNRHMGSAETLYQPESTEMMLSVHSDPRESNGLRFYARDFVQELQRTNARVDGCEPVSIRHQHPTEVGFFVTFAKEVVPDACSSYIFNPETLRFPSDGRLLVTINVPRRPNLPQTQPQSSPASTSDAQPVASTPDTSRQALRGNRRDQAVIDYLHKKMSERGGLREHVHKNRGMKLHNPEIVRDWQRIMEFYNEFINERFPEPSSRKKITKADIVAAFGFRPSWFDDVKDGYDRVKIYGKEGSQPSHTVIAKLEERPETGPEGKVKLLKFLKEFRPQPAP